MRDELILSIIESSNDGRNVQTAKEYFVTSQQQQNKAMKQRDGDVWILLRKTVIKEIDNNLKTVMVLRAQEMRSMIKPDQGGKLRSSWNDIGRAWKSSNSVDTASNVNEITNTTLTSNPDMKYLWNQE